MEMKFRALLSLAVVLLVASLMGCGGHYKCGTTSAMPLVQRFRIRGSAGERERAPQLPLATPQVPHSIFLSGGTPWMLPVSADLTFAGLSGYTAPTLPVRICRSDDHCEQAVCLCSDGGYHHPGFQHQPLDRRSDADFFGQPFPDQRRRDDNMAHGAILKGDSYL